ncbi:MAG: hypothetical protein ACHQIG_13220, partial [Acidimicrobiia bacterium]
MASLVPGPFVRGCAWPGTDEMPYPRADPHDLARLPADTVATAHLPAGVRLELVGDAELVEIEYTTVTDVFGYRESAAGNAFTVVCGDAIVADHPAELGVGTASIALPERDVDVRVVVYLPEAMRPV